MLDHLLGLVLRMRIIIAGVPKAGKTTMAKEIPTTDLFHTDDLIESRDWSEISQFVVDDWMARPGPWIIEGIATVRALRKFMKLHPSIVPCDRIYWMPQPKVEYTRGGQVSMARGCLTVWQEIRPLLEKLEVEIIEC